MCIEIFSAFKLRLARTQNADTEQLASETVSKSSHDWKNQA